MKAESYIQNKRDNISCGNFLQTKGTPSQIFLMYFAQFKNVCFNNTSASDQFKQKQAIIILICFLLKYFYVLSLNFIAKTYLYYKMRTQMRDYL